MEQRILGKNGPSVSAIGLGCMGLSHAYGAPTAKAEARELLEAAIDFGITLFDTAEVYGTSDNPHHNETLLGELLEPYRKDLFIVTKFGISFGESPDGTTRSLLPDARPAAIRRSIEGSLRRLRTDHIDLYLQHRIDPAVEPEIVAETMAALIKEGKIRFWGISEANAGYLSRADAVCHVTAIENRYSMMARHHEALFPLLDRLGTAFIAFSPMANGLLTGHYSVSDHFDPATDYRAQMPQFRPESYQQNQQLMDYLEQLAIDRHATPAMLSLAWMMAKKDDLVPIPGTRHVFRLKEDIGAADIHLSPDEVETIDRALDRLPMSSVFGGSPIAQKVQP